MTEYHDTQKVVNRYLNPWVFTRDVTTIPSCLLRFPDIGLCAKLVWAILSRMSGGKNCAYPKIGTIATEIAVSEATVMRAVEELAEHGFLEKKRRFQRSTVYYFLNHPVFHAITSDNPDEPDDDGPKSPEPLPLDGGPDDDIKLLQNALTEYMSRDDGGSYAERPLTMGVLTKVMMAGNGASVPEVITYLRWLYRHERQPRHANGPKDWGWFVKAVGQRFGHPLYADPVPTHRNKPARNTRSRSIEPPGALAGRVGGSRTASEDYGHTGHNAPRSRQPKTSSPANGSMDEFMQIIGKGA